MSEVLFDRIAEVLEARTALSRLEARGTLRLALREAGLEPGKLTPRYAEALTRKILPNALTSRGVDDAQAVCAAILATVDAAGGGAADSHRPETLFERLQAR